MFKTALRVLAGTPEVLGTYVPAPIPERGRMIVQKNTVGPDGLICNETEYVWDPDSDVEVQAAQAAFAEAKGFGCMQALALHEDTDMGHVIREFDPTARVIFMCNNPFVGG